jgi:chromate reductase
MKVLAIVGGISKDSLNKKLFNSFKELAPKTIQFSTFNIEELPYFSQDLEKDLPASVQQFKEMIRNSDAILFITPEYNRSMPGVLKNSLDWGSRPYGQSAWDGKAAAVSGASTGNIGTFGAQHHLRSTLAYLNVKVMGQPEFYFNGSKSFDQNGKMVDESNRKFVEKFLLAFEKWAQANITSGK